MDTFNEKTGFKGQIQPWHYFPPTIGQTIHQWKIKIWEEY